MQSSLIRAPQSAPYTHEVLLPPPQSRSPDIPDIVGGSDDSPFIVKKSPLIPRPAWLADATDLFVLLCSLLLTTTSIVLVVLVFHARANPSYTPDSDVPSIPFSLSKVSPVLQRIISSLSLTVTSAVIMVAGKRYVLFKLAEGGLRSQRVAVYSNSTIGNLVTYLVLHGAELPLLCLSVVWGLALATGLTVNSSWEMGSLSSLEEIMVPSGPLDLPASSSSWVVQALEQLTFVMSTWCLGLVDTIGLISVVGTNVTSSSALPLGTAYYPPLQKGGISGVNDYFFSTTTTLNGFNVSLEQLSSVPSSALNLNDCVPFGFDVAELWSDVPGNASETFSIIAINSTSVYRVNATAIIMGGTLSSYDNHTEFALNGTSWPNVMSTGNQWALDIINLICNTTFNQSGGGNCLSGLSLADFIVFVQGGDDDWSSSRLLWSSLLNMALGAYSAAMLSSPENTNTSSNTEFVQVTYYGVQLRPTYGIYILLANIMVSIAMLIFVVRLRLDCRLGPDFLNSTRLLLDPLKKPELFNASLQTTVDALGDPYMVVKGDNVNLLAGEKTGGKGWQFFRAFSLRRERSRPTERCSDSEYTTDEAL